MKTQQEAIDEAIRIIMAGPEEPELVSEEDITVSERDCPKIQPDDVIKIICPNCRRMMLMESKTVDSYLCGCGWEGPMVFAHLGIQ